ncbi:hypothetical protein TRVL_04820 [Trypanosoma vivax]|nr:hypothetical protein TRVL_04820 [Trypanosoma vivax]
MLNKLPGLRVEVVAGKLRNQLNPGRRCSRKDTVGIGNWCQVPSPAIVPAETFVLVLPVLCHDRTGRSRLSQQMNSRSDPLYQQEDPMESTLRTDRQMAWEGLCPPTPFSTYSRYLVGRGVWKLF